MRLLLYAFSVMLMLAMPLALGTRLARRYRVNWDLFGVGVVAFVGSQIAHIPFNSAVARAGWLPDAAAGLVELAIVAAFLGLSAGFFEESARYIVYRWWARDARRWKDGIMLGAGHGGIESILLGFALALNVAVLAGIRAGRFGALLPAEQWSVAQAQAEAMFSGPVVLGLLPAAERAFALAVHLSLSLLVLQVFVRRQRRWWWYAVGWHALLNAVAVFAMQQFNIYIAEVAIGVMALISVWFVVKLRRAAGAAEAALSPDATELRPLPALKQPPLSEDKLDDSRFL
ncbi:MAG: YhfC family glutamic-type intramembrane protease [Anaerolineae bacterium]|nr:YhfC family glutamic-type intramembrane protease [Anaerolineae bacterium]